MKPKDEHNNPPNDSQLSRRTLIKTLGLGVGMILPAYMTMAMTYVPQDALDPGETINPLDERSFSEIQPFVEKCIEANKGVDAQSAVLEVLARMVEDRPALIQKIGEPSKAGLQVFLRSRELTIFAATWTPQMNLMPHNHKMWANIGIYSGREDNILWEDREDGLEGTLAKCLFAGDTAMLPNSAIHSVTNPLLRYTGGLHIYGGDFFATERSQWDPESLVEEPSNGDVIQSIFEAANERQKRIDGGR